jgi:hypothetical protein
MTQPVRPSYLPPTPPPARRPPRWLQFAAVVTTGLVVTGAGVGVGMAATSDSSTSGERMGDMGSPPATTTHGQPGGQGKSGKHGGQTTKVRVDAARQAWAHKCGVDRSTMPNLPDVSTASPARQAAAIALLTQTEAATKKYEDLATAKVAGFDLTASLTSAERRKPRLTAALAKIDASGMPSDGRMPMLHVGNKPNRADGKVLDPSAPETLMYEYHGDGKWELIGVMYTANESYPAAPPDPGGPISRWHYHDQTGGQRLMMHIFFVSDLAHAYAAEMDS